MSALSDAAWPLERLGEALEALGRDAGLTPTARALEVPTPPAALEGDALSAWLSAAAAWFSLQVEAVEVRSAEVVRFLRRAGPALLRVEVEDGACFVALLSGGRRHVTLLGPDRAERRVPARELARALWRPLERQFGADTDRLLELVASRGRRSRARRALLGDYGEALRLSGCWLVRPPAGAKPLQLARRAHLPSLLATTLLAHAAEYGAALLAWVAVAQGALSGRIDRGWLSAWLLLLASLIPLKLLSSAAASRFSIAAGTLLKTRLLEGALRLEPNQIRHEGVGQLLGRVIESSAVETLALNGGLTSLTALVEAVMCIAVLAQGTGGLLHVALFAACMAAVGGLAVRHVRRRRQWTDVRLAMTNDLVERMVGHRTRLAQEALSRFHDGEDQALERYLAASLRLDRTSVELALLPRIWLLVGVAALGPFVLAGSAPPTALALALGGVLLGRQALVSLTTGAGYLAGASIAWQRAAVLVRAAAIHEPPPPPAIAVAATSLPDGALLVDAKDLHFRYRERGEPILRGCSLQVHPGERLLLEGPSGGGKSTLGALLTGLRHPSSGLLLLGGLDRHVLGAEAWRRRAVSAPQFHENHVFAGTFAFNLLLGRAWPPSLEDLQAAETLCRELDLGELIDRMPAGLQQMLGETGWQLSHGEKSRLYIARALLQNAELVVLDESFGALDPETLGRTLRTVLERAKTLLVIAHP